MSFPVYFYQDVWSKEMKSICSFRRNYSDVDYCNGMQSLGGSPSIVPFRLFSDDMQIFFFAGIKRAYAIAPFENPFLEVPHAVCYEDIDSVVDYNTVVIGARPISETSFSSLFPQSTADEFYKLIDCLSGRFFHS